MRFIECIFCKFFELFPQFFGLFTIQRLFFFASLIEFTFQFIQHLDDFFTHCLAHIIRLSACEPGQGARQLHNLFLVYNNTICFFQNRFGPRMYIFNFFFAVHTRNKLRNKRDWPRPIQRIQRRYFQETSRVHLAQSLLHKWGIELEYTFGQARLPQLHCFWIICWNFI